MVCYNCGMKKIIFQYCLIIIALVAISFMFSFSSYFGLLNPGIAGLFMFPIYMFIIPSVSLIYIALIANKSSGSNVVRGIAFILITFIFFILYFSVMRSMGL